MSITAQTNRLKMELGLVMHLEHRYSAPPLRKTCQQQQQHKLLVTEKVSFGRKCINTQLTNYCEPG